MPEAGEASGEKTASADAGMADAAASVPGDAAAGAGLSATWAMAGTNGLSPISNKIGTATAARSKQMAPMYKAAR
ncbi:hypothetical protein D3C76_1719940 [compost metagenome]